MDKTSNRETRKGGYEKKGKPVKGKIRNVKQKNASIILTMQTADYNNNKDN